MLRLSPEWAAIFIALFIGLCGIFRENIVRIFFKPKLDVTFQLSQPDSHKTVVTYKEDNYTHETYFLRMRIENNGNYQLDDVEAMVVERANMGTNGKYEKDNEFLPLNLLWSNTGEITKRKIQPKLFKYLDVGRVSEANKDRMINVFSFTKDSKVALVLYVEMMTNKGTYVFVPGEYKIKIIFAANNLMPVTKTYRLFIADKWAEDEDEMFKNNIIIKEILGE
jgi:hypothetical protein